jgi:CheY-like chemotaxis protein
VAAPAGTENLALNYPRGSETILVVDDEEALRTVIVDLLRQLGYQILSAPGGEEALKLAAEYPDRIDLLLSDVIMDGLPGPQLAEELLQSRPELKVVYMSGFADGSLAPKGVLKQGTVLVQKPFTIRMLSAKLREILDQQAAG